MIYWCPAFTCYGDAEESWQGADGQDEAPSSGELPGTDPVQRVLVDGVLVAAQAESVEPGEEDVAVVTVDRGQRQQWQTWTTTTEKRKWWGKKLKLEVKTEIVMLLWLLPIP